MQESIDPLTIVERYLDLLLSGKAPDVDAFVHGERSVDEATILELRKLARVLGRETDGEWRGDERMPETLGDYRVLRRLGAGGMGVVYLARHQVLGRVAALKVIRAAASESESARDRFKREARVIAQLSHRNIVVLYDAGFGDGMSWIALEYVPGRGLDEIVREARERGEPIAPRSAVRWTRDVAQALQCAHDAGVVHRDVKPSNIRIALDGTAKLLDFGLAHQNDSDTLSKSGQIHGTLLYIAPEQVTGRAGEIDGRADVYALGVTLYELVTGVTPHSESSPQAQLHAVLSKEPRAPRELVPTISVDLETVILKAMEKDRSARYPTARAFEEDLQALLDVRPIAARPSGALTRAYKWTRRNPSFAVSLVSAALLLFVAPIVYGWIQRSHSVKLAAEQQRTEASAREARALAYSNALAAAEGALRQNDALPARRLLESCPEDQRGIEWQFLDERTDVSRWTRVAHSDYWTFVGVERGDVRVASAGRDGWLRLWRAQDGELLEETRVTTRLNQASWHPHGRFIACGGDDGVVRVFDTDLKTLAFSFDAGSGRVGGCVHDREATRIAAVTRSMIVVADSTTGRIEWSRSTECEAGTAEMRAIAFAPGGHSLAVGDDAGFVSIRSVVDGRTMRRFEAHRAAVTHLEFARDGETLVTSGEDRAVRLWSSHDDRLVRAWTFDEKVWRARFTPSGTHIAAAGWGQILAVWPIDDSTPRVHWCGHARAPVDLCFSSDGEWMFSGSSYGEIKAWSMQPHGVRVVTGLGRWSWSLAFSPDARRIAVVQDGSLSLRDAESGGELASFVGLELRCVGWCDATIVAGTAAGDAVFIDERGIAEVVHGRHGAEIVAMAVDARGDRMWTASANGIVCLWSIGQRRVLRATTANAPTFRTILYEASTDSLYSGHDDGLVLRHRSGLDQPGERMAHLKSRIFALTFDRWRNELLCGTDAGSIEVLAAQDGSLRGTLLGHTSIVSGFAWLAGGERLVSVSRDRTLRFWDPTARRALVAVPVHSHFVLAVAVDSDETTLATGGADDTLRIWDLRAR